MPTPSIKFPSAFLPVAMSLTALAIVLGHVAIYGMIHEADEGTAAHMFQILMVLEVPMIGYFAVKWLPKNPKAAFKVLAMQAAAAIAAFASVFFLT